MKLADNVPALVLKLGAEYRPKQQPQLFKGVLAALYPGNEVADSRTITAPDHRVDDLVLALKIIVYYDRDCIFIVSGDDFLKICRGELNPVWAFTTGKLKVQGSIDKALEFQKISNRVKSRTESK